MTDEVKDPAAVIAANAVLGDPEASVDQIIEARTAVNDELRQLDKQPRIEPHLATSREQLVELKAAMEERQEMSGILTVLYRRLTDAMQAARARDAIRNADGVRADIGTTLEQAEAAYQEYRRLVGELARMGKEISRDKQAAGHGGAGKIGVDAGTVRRIMALDPIQNTAESRRFERGILLEG
ncbi:hypothetical protein [Halomonas sp. PGE1]|uniref:hypothetical protein n=1 Tax=Halomonas sp. PGE1 TaxID=2730360 RepID=UPI001475D25E|nr:hypothetical protein [Halomonas sp. PGE1]QJQ98208.1 hypothetical protein HIR79_05580 [Halomonas sp. PGE1]